MENLSRRQILQGVGLGLMCVLYGSVPKERPLNTQREDFSKFTEDLYNLESSDLNDYVNKVTRCVRLIQKGEVSYESESQLGVFAVSVKYGDSQAIDIAYDPFGLYFSVTDELGKRIFGGEVLQLVSFENSGYKLGKVLSFLMNPANTPGVKSFMVGTLRQEVESQKVSGFNGSLGGSDNWQDGLMASTGRVFIFNQWPQQKITKEKVDTITLSRYGQTLLQANQAEGFLKEQDENWQVDVEKRIFLSRVAPVAGQDFSEVSAKITNLFPQWWKAIRQVPVDPFAKIEAPKNESLFRA